MKAVSIFFLALAASATAAPRPRNNVKGANFGKGRFGKSGANSNGKASSSASVAASSVVSSAAATATLVANTTGSGSATDLQSSLVLDSSVICTNFTDDGQNPPVAGQSASDTSTNNYINFCALTLPETPLTNGLQITTGSCNPVPIGLIPSVDNMPSCKYLFPKNNSTIPANKAFNAQLNIINMQTGVFTNAQKTYFAAPQTLNSQGQIIGHSHMVIEALSSIDQIEPTDPEKFIFFKGVNDPAEGGVLTVPVTAGVPPGAYRICSINTASNHQPAIVPIAQHGFLDDCSYFEAK